MIIRQQPNYARMIGFGKERRPLDPAPIIQANIQFPHFAIVHVSLVNENGEPRDFINDKGNLTGILMGHLVSTSQLLTDINGEKSHFFIFNDLSIRIPGKYRLKFNLFDMDLSR
jgi:hypothetical protein